MLRPSVCLEYNLSNYSTLQATFCGSGAATDAQKQISAHQKESQASWLSNV